MRPPTNPTAIAFQELLTKLGLPGQVVEFSETTRSATARRLSQPVESLRHRRQSFRRWILHRYRGWIELNFKLVAKRDSPDKEGPFLGGLSFFFPKVHLSSK